MAATAQEGVNSYLTVAAAQAYFDGRLGSEVWTTCPPDQKDVALITATRAIDRLVFKGFKSGGPHQVLQFPRVLSIWPTADRPGYVGQYPFWFNSGADMVTPTEVKDAVCEQALHLLSLSKFQKDRLKEQQLGIVSSGIGHAHEQSSETIVRQLMMNPPLAPEARQLLRNWLGGGVFIT